MKHPRLTPEEIRRERQWRLRAWVMLVLTPSEMGAMLQAASPPTVKELLVLARKRAAEHADRCAICGHPYLAAKAKKRQKRKSFTATKGGPRENRFTGGTDGRENQTG